MTLPEYLNSLTESERDFIAELDYGQDAALHREELNRVIENGGNADLDNQLWYPYEVIELGKNWLQKNHEREFVACAAIILHNIITGEDNINDLDISMNVLLDNLNGLDDGSRAILDPLLAVAIEQLS